MNRCCGENKRHDKKHEGKTIQTIEAIFLENEKMKKSFYGDSDGW